VLKLIVAFKFVFSFDFSTRTTNYTLSAAALLDLYRTIESTEKTNILYTLSCTCMRLILTGQCHAHVAVDWTCKTDISVVIAGEGVSTLPLYLCLQPLVWFIHLSWGSENEKSLSQKTYFMCCFYATMSRTFYHILDSRPKCSSTILLKTFSASTT